MSHKETIRSEDGGSSKLAIYDTDGQEIITAQRDGDLVTVWVRGLGTIGNDAAFVLGRWLAETEGRLPDDDRQMIGEDWARTTGR